uniref:Uncharacterized protein n=1 Tax=Timema monikensis TaxID=170555 RepID=A0A7R9HJM9_9NEOP|nr:unnamed protein product [Timema monikensis]
MVGGLEPPQSPAWVRYCYSQNKLDTADDGEIGIQIIVGYNGCPTPGCKKLLAMPGNKSNRSTAKQGVKCPACKKHVRHDEALATLVNCEAWFKEGIESMEVGDVDVAIRLFCSYLDSMHSVGFPPHKDILLCQEALRICMAGSGNVWVTGKIDASSNSHLRNGDIIHCVLLNDFNTSTVTATLSRGTFRNTRVDLATLFFHAFSQGCKPRVGNLSYERVAVAILWSRNRLVVSFYTGLTVRNGELVPVDTPLVA